MSAEVHHGDAREVLAGMQPESVHCVITSPLSDTHAVQGFASKVECLTPCHVLVAERFGGNQPGSAIAIWEILVTSDFGPVIAPLSLERPKFQYDFSPSSFHQDVWEDRADDHLGCGVRSLVTEQRPAFGGMSLLWIVPASKGFSQEFDRPFVDHPDLKAGVVTGRLPALAGIRRGLFDSDVSFTIDKASNIRQCSIRVFHSVVISLYHEP